MKIAIQKAITNPLRILGAPYGLAMLNFAVFFILFIVFLVVFQGNANPLYFLVPFMASHYTIARISSKEPQMGRIISANLKIIRMKIPRNLIS
ncbi:MAG: VirB3 family type IV secretion system protein [Rickettsiales bacterium]|jgi:type IV secretory pathway VirB3-like protein|nr:VirB3 family type IV secretion system protein [Rickettsiales bacterium]